MHASRRKSRTFPEAASGRLNARFREPKPGEKWANQRSGSTDRTGFAPDGNLGGDIKAREIRCLRSDGRQSSIITTNNQMDINQVAGSILSRWSQENFFLYARREFGLDHLPVHEREPVDPAEKVVNPPWRRLKKAIAKLKNRLGHLTRRIDAQSKTTQPVGKLQTKKIDLAKELQELCQTQKSLPEHVS